MIISARGANPAPEINSRNEIEPTPGSPIIPLIVGIIGNRSLREEIDLSFEEKNRFRSKTNVRKRSASVGVYKTHPTSTKTAIGATPQEVLTSTPIKINPISLNEISLNIGIRRISAPRALTEIMTGTKTPIAKNAQNSRSQALAEAPLRASSTSKRPNTTTVANLTISHQTALNRRKLTISSRAQMILSVF